MAMLAALMVSSIFLTAMPTDAIIPATSLEIRGQTANETAGMRDNLDLSSGRVSWQPQNFAGLFYDANYELGNENLTILDSGSLIGTRTIQLDKLIYTTSGDDRLLNVVKNPFNGNYTAAYSAGLRQFQAGSMGSEDGKYKIVGWQAEKYVGIKNKTNKLASLIIEQGAAAYEKKTLVTGETWDIGRGWRVTITEINAAVPRYIRLNLSKDGLTKGDSIIYSNNVYTYVEGNIAGETDVPLFVTYVDSIFQGATSNMTQLRYTWVIDTNVTEIRTGDSFGVFNVTAVDLSMIQLRNTLSPVSLSRSSIIDLMGNMKFRVADSNTLRFYPVITKTIPGMYEVRGQTANETAGIKGNLGLSSGRISWQPQNFAGFFYDADDELGRENLTILDSSSLIGTRTIQPNKLIYTTRGDNRPLNVVKYQFSGNYFEAENAGLRQFQAGSMSSEAGKYKIIGWQAEKYVSIKNKTNKLSRLIIEQGTATSEKKTIMVGETWNVGGGWSLTVQSVDARAYPRQTWLVLSKNGIKKSDIVAAQGQIATYVESSLAGEIDVPLFVTYIDSIFVGATSEMVQFRYTWVIDTNVTEISAGDRFGVFNVTAIDPSVIQLKNSEYPVSLFKDSTIDLMGSMKFKVADSNTLRFYPEVDYEVFLPPAPPCYNSTISGYNFRDININGVKNAGEPGIFNWTIRLRGRDKCTNADITRMTKTNATGYFEFKNVTTGTYLLSEKIPAGWIPTTPGVYNLSLPHFTTTIRKDFGNIFYP